MGLGFGFGVKGFGFRVVGSGLWVLGFEVWGLGFRKASLRESSGIRFRL